ncbi:MAG: RICIN domain-containing protein [Polyangia bacterium]
MISANISAGALTAGSSEGTIASLSSYSDLPSQLWVIQQNGSSGYNVVNVGGGLVLDDNNGGSSTQCHQWAWSTTNANQNWTLTAR